MSFKQGHAAHFLFDINQNHKKKKPKTSDMNVCIQNFFGAVCKFAYKNQVTTRIY